MAGLSRRALLTRVAASAPPDGAVAGGAWLRVHRTAMACRVEVVLPGEGAGHLAAARAALDEADRLEAMLTVFRDTSDLVRINRGASRAPVAAPAELFEILTRSVALHRASEGAFDIASTPLSRCWGFIRRAGRLPAPGEIDAARGCVTLPDVVLDETARTVFFRHPGLELNLNAIGKGFVLERMAATLRASGVTEALISAGGSSVCAVGGGASGWRVDLRSLVRGDMVGMLRLRDAALGTSGAGEQFFIVNGVRYGHVIDPRSGWPAVGTRSASVVTPRAADADALSTAFLIGGVELARRYCARYPDVLAIVTPEDGPPQVFGACRGASVSIG